MSRMLEALQQIETQSPQPRPTVQPVSPEELESFGLRRSPGSQTQESPSVQVVPETEAGKPAEPAEPDQRGVPATSTDSSEATAPREPEEVGPPGEQGDAVLAEVDQSDPAPQAAPACRASRNVRRLLSPLADEHREPYRQLAASILAELSPDRPAVLLFTSPSDGEAKTGVVAALAVAIAEEVAEDVVVVDADFRSPALAGDFGIWADQGLAEVLTGAKPWHDVVRKTSAKHLSVLPGGRFPGGDEPLPEDAKLASLLETLRRSHRLVLVHAASLQYAEVAPLSGLCDGTYLVITLGRTHRDAARRAVRRIKRCGGRLLGCVVTNVASQS
jgi:Mrp family chromosome partitioning ATPase